MIQRPLISQISIFSLQVGVFKELMGAVGVRPVVHSVLHYKEAILNRGEAKQKRYTLDACYARGAPFLFVLRMVT